MSGTLRDGLEQPHPLPEVPPMRVLPAFLAFSSLLAACGDRGSDQAAADVARDSAPDVTADSTSAATDMQSVLTAHGALGPKPIETLTPAEARMQPTPADAVMRVLLSQGKDTVAEVLVPGVTSVDRRIPGPAGPLPVRIYTPEGEGPFPVIVYFHGGGWVIGSKAVYDGGARSLAKGANAVVVSVDYRLAPEHKFPAQHDDALASYRWAREHAASINGRADRIALAGESAGGNLAVATAIAAVGAGIPRPVHVLAVYPIAQADTTTPSYVRHADAKPLNRTMMNWFAAHTVRTPADLQDPRISLVNAPLAGLPTVTIISAGIDPLLSDGEMLEKALQTAGVTVERRTWNRASHEFFGMGAVVADARDAHAYAATRLRTAFE